YKTFKPQRMLLPPPGSTVRKWHDASFRLPGPSPRRFIKRQRMDYFAQQLINGLVLGSIYGLIAIGYTMVYGIVGMINFAHGDIDHADDAIDHRVADRDQAVDRAEHETVDELLGEVVHALPLDESTRRGPRQPERRVVPFSNSGTRGRQQHALRLKCLV